MHSHESPRVSISDLLSDHHGRLDRACLDLLSDTYADDPRVLHACWRRFENELEQHMKVEETSILPLYEAAAPGDAQAIRADHAGMRELLQRIAVDVELHQIRASTVRELLARLRDHAAREDRGMYRWASTQLPHKQQRSIRDYLRALLATALASR